MVLDQKFTGNFVAATSPDWCDARCFLSTIEERIAAAIILPQIKDYPPDQIELISVLPIRDTLGIRDEQVISIKIFLE